jgi:hypothetical protein
MCNVKTGGTATISKLVSKYLSNIPGNHDIFELQKISIPDTAQIIRDVQRHKYKTFIMENSITGRLSHTVTVL